MFGLAGASRSGKSTLARAVSEATGIQYQTISTSKLAADLGYNLVAPMSVTERIEAQEKLLQSYLDVLDGLPGMFIVDRTPIDMIAYTICEVGMLNTDPELGRRIKSYVDHALSVTARRFATILVLRPLPFYESEPDKHPENVAYQWHTQFTIEGVIDNLIGSIESATLTQSDMEWRLRTAVSLITQRLTGIAELHKAAQFH